MSRPFFTVVVPTQGRPALPRLLESLDNVGRLEILVVADTHSPLLCDVAAIANTYGARYIELDAGTHAWGYPQIQHGYDLAEGEYILCIGDDDVYEPGAFDAIWAAIEEHGRPAPFLFRVELHPSPTRGCRRPVILWDEPRLLRGRISTQNLVVPNVKDRLGHWWDDFCFIEATVNRWGGQAVWRDELIARCY